MLFSKLLFGALLFLSPVLSFAAGGDGLQDFTGHWVAIVCVIIFVLAYSLVIVEVMINLRKSKPVIVAAGLLWALVAIMYSSIGDNHTAEAAVRHNLIEFAELFLFLLAAMTYINTVEERGIFDM